MTPQLAIILIACITAAACALPGLFLVLRGMALMSDAISHATLLGIALMFFWTQNLSSPFLLLGASLAGLATVALTELLIKKRHLKKDAAIGLVFPLFFSLGVILISLYGRSVHLDADMVLLGELALAPFNRLTIYGFNVGPYALWVMSGLLLINAGAIKLFYKELQLATFDQTYAATIGFAPATIHWGLMALTSITAVGAFDIVGAIVVVALMIVPAATAFLCTKDLTTMIQLSLLFGILATVTGYELAHLLDASIAGAIATMSGLIFFICIIRYAKNHANNT
ncbi:MAG: metal ABC transporter permease [Candidatus Babeliales bacterium]